MARTLLIMVKVRAMQEADEKYETWPNYSYCTAITLYIQLATCLLLFILCTIIIILYLASYLS